jgi:ABC-type uncharacterized transport system substrate-binding protein
MVVKLVSLAAATAFVAQIVAATPACAHPHVWASMRVEVVYGTDGAATGVRHAWTFDDLFSSFATMGIDAKKPGEFTREELRPLAQTNVESLKEYDYFTFASVNGAKPKALFAEPLDDYWLSYEPKAGVLTLHFTLRFRAPVRAKALDIEVYDPLFFIYFGFAEKNPVRLVGAPPQCKASVVRAKDAKFPSSQRGAFAASEANAGMGAQFAEKIAVRCP